MSVDTNTLDSMCELVADCPHSTPKWTDSGVIVLRNNNIRNGSLDLSNPSFTDEEHYLQRIKRAKPQAGDIVFTREAPMGEVCIIPEGLKCCLGQRQVLLRPKNEICGEYLFFALQSPAVQNEISWNEGTGSTVSNVRIPVLKNLNIPRHAEFEIQIAKILGSLSCKIELNREINQILEEIAQTIFKSWFVYFEPVKAKIEAKEKGQDPERAAMCAISGKTNDELDQLTPEELVQLSTTAALFPDKLVDSELGLLPKNWCWKPLEDVMELNPKRTLKKGVVAKHLEMKNMPIQGHLAVDWRLQEMGSGTKFVNGDTLMARITPCLENGKTAFVDFLDEGEVGWGSTEYIVIRSKRPLPVQYSYLLARDNDFRSHAIQYMTGTSGRQRVNASSLGDYHIAISDSDKIYDKFASVLESIMKKIKCHGEQSKTLVQTRDVLLPKLLSGEFNVSGNDPAVSIG